MIAESIVGRKKRMMINLFIKLQRWATELIINRLIKTVF